MLPSSSRDSACRSHFLAGAGVECPALATEGMVMASRNLTERVEGLEMEAGSLKELPGRVSAVESQIVELRAEMRGEFSAVRSEMRDMEGRLQREMRSLNEETRAEMREIEGTLRQEMKAGREDLRAEVRTLNEETKAQMRTLHEEVLDRIAKIGESAPSRRKRRR
jgi:hypothetical protein